MRTLRLVASAGKRQSRPSGDLSQKQQARVRRIIDRLQVLVLTHPVVAAWLLDWVDRFMDSQLP